MVVPIVIHNCRWRLGLADGESRHDDLETRLAEGLVLIVPATVLEGGAKSDFDKSDFDSDERTEERTWQV